MNGLGMLMDALSGEGDVLGNHGGMNVYDPYGSALGAVGRPNNNAATIVRALKAAQSQIQAARTVHAVQERGNVQRFAQEAAEGTSERKLKRAPLGLGQTQIDATATTASLSSQAQKPFQARRLFLVAADTAGTPAAGLELVTSIQVGVDSQLVGTDALPFDAFSPDSVGVGIAGTLNAISQTMSIGLLRNPAPGVGATRGYAGVAFGETIGG